MWRHGVPIGERGPGESYRPDDAPPSLYAPRQPGITTPLLDHLAFGALDVVVGTVEHLRDLMQVLTAEGERLMRAEHRHARDGPAGALTVTIGLGPLLFGERFGARHAVAGRAVRAAGVRGRSPRPGHERRRPGYPGVRGPAGQGR